jgi:hypothetical protein
MTLRGGLNCEKLTLNLLSVEPGSLCEMGDAGELVEVQMGDAGELVEVEVDDAGELKLLDEFTEDSCLLCPSNLTTKKVRENIRIIKIENSNNNNNSVFLFIV